MSAQALEAHTSLTLRVIQDQLSGWLDSFLCFILFLHYQFS